MLYGNRNRSNPPDQNTALFALPGEMQPQTKMASPVVRHRVKINEMALFKNIPTDATCPPNRIGYSKHRDFVQTAEDLTRHNPASTVLDHTHGNELFKKMVANQLDAQMRKDLIN